MTIWLLCGPPGSGKDSGAAFFKGRYPNLKFSTHLKVTTHVDFGLYDIPVDHFEDCKDEKTPIFYGMSPRQAYIHKAECQVKPFFGKDFYGQMFLRLYEKELNTCKNVLVTDSGFIEEVIPVISKYGSSNIKQVCIHAENRGKGFENDSRSYWTHPDIEQLHIENNGNITDYRKTLTNLVGE